MKKLDEMSVTAAILIAGTEGPILLFNGGFLKRNASQMEFAKKKSQGKNSRRRRSTFNLPYRSSK